MAAKSETGTGRESERFTNFLIKWLLRLGVPASTLFALACAAAPQPRVTVEVATKAAKNTPTPITTPAPTPDQISNPGVKLVDTRKTPQAVKATVEPIAEPTIEAGTPSVLDTPTTEPATPEAAATDTPNPVIDPEAIGGGEQTIDALSGLSPEAFGIASKGVELGLFNPNTKSVKASELRDNIRGKIVVLEAPPEAPHTNVIILWNDPESGSLTQLTLDTSSKAFVNEQGQAPESIEFAGDRAEIIARYPDGTEKSFDLHDPNLFRPAIFLERFAEGKPVFATPTPNIPDLDSENAQLYENLAANPWSVEYTENRNTGDITASYFNPETQEVVTVEVAEVNGLTPEIVNTTDGKIVQYRDLYNTYGLNREVAGHFEPRVVVENGDGSISRGGIVLRPEVTSVLTDKHRAEVGEEAVRNGDLGLGMPVSLSSSRPPGEIVVGTDLRSSSVIVIRYGLGNDDQIVSPAGNDGTLWNWGKGWDPIENRQRDITLHSTLSNLGLPRIRDLSEIEMQDAMMSIYIPPDSKLVSEFEDHELTGPQGALLAHGSNSRLVMAERLGGDEYSLRMRLNFSSGVGIEDFGLTSFLRIDDCQVFVQSQRR